MKLREIIDATPLLFKISSADISLKISYQVMKFMAPIQKELEFFESERVKIRDKHGSFEDGIYKYHDGENEAAAEKAFNELLDFESQLKIVPLVIPITENIKISANDLLALAPFISIKE